MANLQYNIVVFLDLLFSMADTFYENVLQRMTFSFKFYTIILLRFVSYFVKVLMNELNKWYNLYT